MRACAENGHAPLSGDIAASKFHEMRVLRGWAGGVRAWSCAVVALTASALSGCSNSDSTSGGAGGSGGASAGAPSGGSSGASASVAGQGGGSSGSQSSAGGGSSGAAALWSRAGATCTTLGEDCSQCFADTICYDNPPLACVPQGSGVACGVGSCAADTPYRAGRPPRREHEGQ